MKLYVPTSFFVVLMFFFNCADAQKQKDFSRCATVERLEKIFAKNPALKARFEDQKREFNRSVEQKRFSLRTTKPGLRAEAVYYIPVVFHIVSTNPNSVTDAQIQAQLDVLNADFAGTNADSTNIPSYFKPLFGKSIIQFCLAQRNPLDDATSGVERVTTSVASFNYLNDEMKYTSSGGTDAWDPNKYFNVWICSLADGILGYATFPGDGLPNAQGVVVDFRSLPGGSFTGYNQGKTLTHESGHYFNLYHIWGDDNGQCTGTDYVSDTPNQGDATSGCYTGVKTDNCTSSGNGIMYQNYMDYSYDNCLVMFTSEQVIRMEAASIAYRSSLLNSDGCIPLTSFARDAKLVSINEPAGRICSSSFTPRITIKNVGTTILSSLNVHYRIDGGTVTNYAWTGSLNQYASADITLPAATTTEGNHSLQVYITDPNNNPDENPSNDTLSKSFTYFSAVQNVSESFENSLFPPTGWDIVNPDNGITWEKVIGIAKTGSASVKINNFDYTSIGQQDYLRMPTLNIAGKDSAFLSFYVAATTVTATNTAGNAWDTLEVLLSKDCGKTYTTLYKKYGANLVTRKQATTTAFVPAANEWRKDSIDLGNYIDAGDVLIAFRNTTGYENNIYLDDINVRTVTINPNLKAKGFLVTPNPTNGIIQVQFYPQPDDLTGIQIVSSSGQKISETKISSGQANNFYSYDLSRFPAGVYIIRAIFTDRVVIKKVVKN